MNHKRDQYWDMVQIEVGWYIYRVQHILMEGDCPCDDGPRLVNINGFQMDKYPVTNQKYKQLKFLLSD